MSDHEARWERERKFDAIVDRVTPPITLEELSFALEVIQLAAGDSEVAHGMEDDMRDSVLRAVAAGVPNAKELAAFALSSGEIKFERWFA